MSQSILSYNLKKQLLMDNFLGWNRRKKLIKKDFSIICNNCLAATGVYHKYGLPFNTPTIGTLFFYEDYIKFLENFYFYINQPLEFISGSKYRFAKTQRLKKYPLAILGGDVEVHFVHYKSNEEAKEKWERRRSRINFSNLYFMLIELTTEEKFEQKWLERFAKLPFEHKVFISSQRRGYDNFTIQVKSKTGKEIQNLLVGRPYERAFDIESWLNGESTSKCKLYCKW